MQYEDLELHYGDKHMKKLLIAAIGILAASLLSTNSFAFPAGQVSGIQAGENAVKVHFYRHGHCHACRPLWDQCHHFRLCHYPLPNWAVPGGDCCCSLIWPF